MNDYHVIVFQILSYLYGCLKEGKEPEPEAMDNYKKIYDINTRYWSYIWLHLAEDGLIEGVHPASIMNVEWKTVRFTNALAITPRGIDYLMENSMMEKIKQLGANSVTGVASAIAAGVLNRL